MESMKKHMLFNKIFILSLSAVISMGILAGCQNKNTASAKQGTNKGQNKNRQFNAEDMKKRMEENINSLVADGTINQSQADKIIEALTSNPQGFGGNGQRNKQNGQKNNGENNGQDNQNNNGQNRQGNNALNKLVTDGVITQAQADAVMQKIRGNFTRNQNNTNKQNNQNNQNNSNGGNKTT
ncbi:hypothetical protein [Clostridium omnivorum]|uniref:Lipoprotein n=1 Tax=Clostridium omnivorum TaxID=1604902 RepID=A0ABQ5N6Q4_9CLOT|nr:hypothetical protein [Clostridium sp. E14]GLC30830.1 hypothetical protein bsdE14_22400 [Clostridium sp. E14]